MLRYVLLALLRDGVPAHGYALMKSCSDRLGIPICVGNVYRELQRLMSDGLITTATNPDDADPRRAPYVLVEAGREELDQWVRRGARADHRASLDELSYRLAVSSELRPEEAEELLADTQAALVMQTQAVERDRARLRSESGEGVDGTFPIRAVLLARRAMQLEIDLDLVEEIRVRLAEKETRRKRPAPLAPRSAPRSVGRSGHRMQGSARHLRSSVLPG